MSSESLAAGSSNGRGFRLGDWTVHPDSNRLVRNGATLHLRPKVMDVLVFLAEHPGEVVANETITTAVWGKRFLARSALAGAVCELREVLGDDSHQPRFIETVAKRGYRLLAPIATIAEQAPARPAEGVPRKALQLRWAALGLVAVVAATATGLALRHTARTPKTPAAPYRLVVLPFEDLGSQHDDFFVLGITEEITTRLAGLRGLAVIAHNSAVHYARSDKSLATIARELNVEYVLLGSVRRNEGSGGSGNVRISARLVRAADGTVLWADAWDGTSSDVLAIQGEIGRRVVRALNVTLSGCDRDALATIEAAHPEAYQAYLRGRYYLQHLDSEENLLLAVRMFERAVELDPGFVAAGVGLARSHAIEYHFGFDHTAERRRLAEQALARARALAPTDRGVEGARAYFRYVFDHDYAGVLADLAEARREHQPTADEIRFEGFVLRRAGRFHESLDRLTQVAELDPSDFWLVMEIGTLEAMLGRYAEADRDYARSIELSPDQETAYALRARNLLVWKGSLADSRALLAMTPPLARPSLALRWWDLDLFARDFDAAFARLSALPEGGVSWQDGIFLRSLLEGETLWLKGDRARARDSFEEARKALEQRRATTANDWRVHSALGIAYAGLGRGAEARAEARRAVELCPRSWDAIDAVHPLTNLARVEVMLGDHAAAMGTLEQILAVPLYPEAVPLLTLDPWWEPLKSQPGFAALLARMPGSAT